MKFEKVLYRDVLKNEIILGYNKLGELIINLQENPSLIITGETGSGKSILLDQILVQQINKMTSLELGIIPIDTTGVELNYYANSKYTLYNAINDSDKAIVAISRVLKEIERRKDLLKSNKVLTVDEYNEISESKLPTIILAIDDNKSFLKTPDLDMMISTIITQIKGLNIYFILATSDVHNSFFEKDKNTLASVNITFDYTNPEEAKKVNIKGADNLSLGNFFAKIDGEVKEYNSFEFDDAIIDLIVNK